MEKMDAEVVVVRSFISFLFCGRHLMKTGKSFLILEARNRIGMEQIPYQLAENIPQDQIHVGAKVESVDNGSVALAIGQKMNGNAIVLATEGQKTQRLLKRTD